MTRILGLFGFTGGFLLISPDLRQTVLAGASSLTVFADQHSPYSYIALVLLVFGGITLSLQTGQGTR